MKTYSAKPTDVVRKWYLIDAADAPLGRIATVAATLLTGKGKAQFTRHIDCGDFVIIINASNLVTTGNKLLGKQYNRHSGYPGGLTTTSLKNQLMKEPTIPVYKAVRGMLPVNKLRDARLQRLKIYAGTDHNHVAQQPTRLTLAKTRVKNSEVRNNG